MKQGIRFILKPQTFFNQLQWSTNHWMILVTFLVLALVETQIGRHHELYASFASFLQYRWGVNSSLALWAVMAGRLAMLLVGAFIMTNIIYLLGSVVGQPNSRRVFSRRLAVVFTVLLAGFTMKHYTVNHPDLNFISFALYGWAILLGFIAIKEQFELSPLQAGVVALFAVLIVSTGWQFSNRLMEIAMRDQIHSLAIKPAPRDQFKLGTGF